MAIIGISGKIGSGKDTVGKIIQYLTYKEWKTLEGEKGKDAPYDLKDWLDDSQRISINNSSNTWEIKKFAAKLKQVCSLLTGIPVEDFEKQRIKDSLLRDEWTKIHCCDCNIEKEFKNPSNLAVGYYECPKCKVSGITNHKWFNPTVRWLLQTVGTEAMRNSVHENVWVNALFADYKSKFEGKDGFTTYNNITDAMGNDIGITVKMKDNPIFESSHFPNWIITDMRFPNELEAVKRYNGITIRINRKQFKGKFDKKEHPSETSLDNAKFDYVINNDGTIKDLVKKVREVLIKEKIVNE